MKLNQNSISRRGFLQGAAVASLAMGAGLYGCSSANGSGEDDSAPAQAAPSVWDIEELGEPAETLTADVCVVGGGGTGMAASIQAKQLGLDVLLIEKHSQLGGSFSGTEGMFAIGTQWQKDAGIELNKDDLLVKAVEFHHYVASQELYKAFFDKSASNIEWCESLGIKFAEVRAMGASDPCWHVYEGAPAPGAQFVENMIKAVEKHEIRTEFELSGKKLLTNEDGSVAGLLAARADGTVVQIDCPAVIVGTGGFSNNMGLVEELGNNPDLVAAMLDNGRTGDGIKMVKAAGGAMVSSPGTLMTGGPSVIGTSFGVSEAFACGVQPAIWLNERAQRYVREDMFERNFSYAGQSSAQQKRVLSFVNQALVDRFESGEGALVGVGTHILKGTQMPNLSRELESLIEMGIVAKGDTVEDLAAQFDLDGNALRATLDRYNEMCANGRDEDMFKPAEFMIAMEEGPYYLMDCYVSYLTTVGGVKVNPNAEVLRDDSSVIPGLYAGGCDAGGLYGDTYDVYVAPGSQAAWCIYTGRVAAEQAATYIA